MSIREFTENDYPIILEIYAQTKLDELRYENKMFELLPLEKDKIRLEELMESDIYLYDNGSVLAYGAICDKEIRALFVLPKSRGVGIGKELLKFLITKTSSAAILHVAESNNAAKNLYENCGFKVTETFETTYNGMPVFANKMIRPIGNE